MKIISFKKLDDYAIIEIEKSFLFFKWKRKYVMTKKGHVFGFKKPNHFYQLSWHEESYIGQFFYLENLINGKTIND